MSPEHEIDYEALIDRSIIDFQPVKRLWPASTRLVCWVLLEAAILGLAVWVVGYANVRALYYNSRELVAAGLFIAASIGAAFLALKSATPGREVTWPQLAMVIAIVAAAFGFELAGRPFNGILQAAPTSMLQLFALAALPWLSLFWAVRRGVPLQPEVSGVVVGLAAFSFAAALCQIITEVARVPNSGMMLALSCTVVIVLSALAAAEGSAHKWAFSPGVLFPLALSTSIAALIFVLIGPGQHIARIPDFDLAIESYQRALVDFRPNVPSSSMDTMLTAYVEHGMPAYMWDFGPEGFRLVGGRWDRLPDGTPVTYTWFSGAQGGVMCIFRQTDAFNPPLITHDERHRLLFYRYRGFSFCLINVGGYGNFISVIAAPMPLMAFEQLVLAATL
jgi:hypothetical protein